MRASATAIYDFLKLRSEYSLRRLLGNGCIGCGEQSKNIICDTCYSGVTKPLNNCSCCGIALVTITQSMRCRSCIQKPPAFEQLNYIGNYDGLLSQWIVQSKLHHNILATQGILELTKQHIQQQNNWEYSDYALLPVPIPQLRLMHRGFNLPNLIATVIANEQHNSIISSHVVKTPKWQKKQTVLSKKQREEYQKTFIITKKMPEKVLIIDDVATTCTTINSLSKSLRKMGAKHVSAWCLARSQWL